MSTPLPPPIALYQIGTGHYFSRALDLAARLGIADLLRDGPRDAEALAAACEARPAALRRVLRLLVSVGVFMEDEAGRFALMPTGELLRSDVEGSMRAAVQLFAGPDIQDSWKELEYCVKTGEPAFRKFSPEGDAFSDMAAKPEQAAVFDEAMAAFTSRIAVVVASAYDFSRFGTIADIGGGNGALLLGILKAHAEPKGIVFDLPKAAERARREVERAGLASRCDVVAGDFFAAVPPSADAYLLKHVIHDWDDGRAQAILGHCRAAMADGGTLLLLEGIYPERVDQSPECRGAAANDVNMLVNTGGRQRSEREFRDLFESAGFRLTRIVPTPANVCVIEGEPV
ncbi:MAG: methyltransferase [Myxococcota bacterium]|nr:methyltransferase [Myxococcota bacterium]